MIYSVSAKNKTIEGTVRLPASKSISNRVMIINALSYNPYPARNLSDCDDTNVMAAVLNSNSNKFDIGHAGTAMRFLTAFLSKIVGEWEITGSERMQQRPIAILVDALRKLGANIQYLGKEGYPPLRIYGSRLKGQALELDGSVSSQYITALLLIAPTIEGGLTLRLQNKITSESYIRLTLELMAKFGIRYKWDGSVIEIPEQNYFPIDFTVEADWSAASYWYQIAAMAEKADISLPDLLFPGLQGDSAIKSWFDAFGVETKQTAGGLRLVKTEKKSPSLLSLDFKENPDVAQTMAVLCVSQSVPFSFSGLETLKIKETNRILALQNQLVKFGAKLEEPFAGSLSWDGKIYPEIIQPNPVVATYDDHRMAMAFAPMALTGVPLRIQDPMVVTKSYPHFWDGLRSIGFEVSESK
jgi:3-phosphoshikimate 1-carboxyvinyltransferase